LSFAVSTQAQDARTSAAQLSDQAFALLNSLTAPAGSTNPALGPVAGFAADAQTLSRALAGGNQADAGTAMAALIADRSAIDAAVAAHSGSLNPSDWNSLKQQLAKLAERVTPADATVSGSAPVSGAAGTGAVATSSTGAAANGDTAGAGKSDLPKVRIESYMVPGHVVRIRGFFEGADLKSAGIYDGDRLIRDLKVTRVGGPQHVTFDIELAEVQPGMLLRVYDSAGLSAEASVATRLGIDGTGGAKEVELESPNEPPSEAPVSLGDEVASVETGSGGHNVAEIPTSPVHRHGLGHSRLGDFQVTVISVSREDATTYDVMGQINGSGVSRAGIYVDGNLAKLIDIDDDGGFTTQPFDETFQMAGRRATIRVYNRRDEYLESPIRLAEARSETPEGFPSFPAPIGMNPNQLAVQLSAVRPLAPNVLLVTGVLSGKNLAAAGLYQNGVQVQSLPVSNGILSALSPDAFRQVDFSAQFNPAAGPADVRLFDTNGQFAEQPIILAGIPVNPYAANPYGSGINTYGNAYGNPYGPRFGGNAYGYPPPGYSPPASSSNKVPWWLKLLR
jgi:plastocyanin